MSKGNRDGLVVFLFGFILCAIMLASMAMVRYSVGKPVPCEIYTASDPCDPIYQFLAPTDPNWAASYGDNERTRLIMNISANRGISLRNQQVLAEVAKRMIALEESEQFRQSTMIPEIVDPNEVKE